MSTITAQGTLHIQECPECGCLHAIPDGIERNARKHAGRRDVYCPNGHVWVFMGKTHEQQLREARDARAAAEAARDQAEADARMARAREEKERKRAQRLAKRASAGVCPCCNRSFQQLSRHMKTKHPEFVPA